MRWGMQKRDTRFSDKHAWPWRDPLHNDDNCTIHMHGIMQQTYKKQAIMKEYVRMKH